MDNIFYKIRKCFGPEVYLVGGAVRDAVLKRPCFDFDFVVGRKSNFHAKIKRLASELKTNFFLLDRKNNLWRMTRQKTPTLQIDISPITGNSIDADLARRDFTINSLACRMDERTGRKISLDIRKKGIRIKGIKKSDITDPFGGLEDLQKKSIKVLSGRSIPDDPLRMLRAFRIASQLNFTIAKTTLACIKTNASFINKSAPERIHDELMFLMAEPNSADYLEMMHKNGIITSIMPEFKPAFDCARVYYGRGGVWKHTVKVVDRMEYFFENLKKITKNHKDIKKIPVEKEALKMAALLHDIAKPAKARIINKRLRFFGHEDYGSVMAERILEKLRFSKNHIKLISTIIKYHLRPGNLASNEKISHKAIFRFFRDIGENAIGLLILCWADYASYISPKHLELIIPELSKSPAQIPARGMPRTGIVKTLRFLQVIHLLLGVYFKKKIGLTQSKLIDGHNVMKILNLPEGPAIGQILNRVKMLQFEGKIKNQKQAIAFLKNIKKIDKH